LTHKTGKAHARPLFNLRNHLRHAAGTEAAANPSSKRQARAEGDEYGRRSRSSSWQANDLEAPRIRRRCSPRKAEKLDGFNVPILQVMDGLGDWLACQEERLSRLWCHAEATILRPPLTMSMVGVQTARLHRMASADQRSTTLMEPFDQGTGNEATQKDRGPDIQAVM